MTATVASLALPLKEYRLKHPHPNVFLYHVVLARGPTDLSQLTVDS